MSPHDAQRIASDGLFAEPLAGTDLLGEDGLAKHLVGDVVLFSAGRIGATQDRRPQFRIVAVEGVPN